MKTLKFARFAVAAVALAVGGAHATLITNWDVTDVATFISGSENPTGLAADGYPALSVDGLSLRWGRDASGGLTVQSGLDITNLGTQFNRPLGATSTTITVTHLNHPVQTPTLSSVDILATIVLNPSTPLPLGWPAFFPSPFIDGDTTFKIKFIETPNQPGTTCADGTTNGVGINAAGCADIFVIDNTETDFSFIVPDWDGSGETYQYSVKFFGTGFNVLSNGACLAAGIASGNCSGFRTAEDADTTAFFDVRIDAQKVPEPGSLALLGLGLLGLGAARRRTSLK